MFVKLTASCYKRKHNKTLLENDDQFFLFCKSFEEKGFEINYDLNKEIRYFLGANYLKFDWIKSAKNEPKVNKQTKLKK
jgi:hypothetical protein